MCFERGVLCSVCSLTPSPPLSPPDGGLGSSLRLPPERDLSHIINSEGLCPSLSDIVEESYSFSSRALLRLLCEGHGLMGHLKSLQRFFLLEVSILAWVLLGVVPSLPPLFFLFALVLSFIKIIIYIFNIPTPPPFPQHTTTHHTTHHTQTSHLHRTETSSYSSWTLPSQSCEGMRGTWCCHECRDCSNLRCKPQRCH